MISLAPLSQAVAARASALALVAVTVRRGARRGTAAP
jgi:hypothetical protein